MLLKTYLVVLITLLPLSPVFIIFWSSYHENLRLPTHIWPESYNITIQTFLQERERLYNFSGSVEIRIKTLITTNYIALHSRDLNYSSIKYWAEKRPFRKLSIEKMRFYKNTERITIHLRHFLEPHNYYIFSFKYMGLIKNESFGIFLKEYEEANKLKGVVLATQFQPIDARSAFPCFDEPQFKATFRVRIIRPYYMKSFSNTPRECTHMKNGLSIDTFKVTPVMSTYTLAFLITSFDERKESNNERFSVLARPEVFNQTKLCFELGLKILTALSNYFNMSYYDLGIDKLTLVLLDVSFSGMENWGLIVLMESSVLYNENDKIQISKIQSIANLLAHELTHLWFGNLVTCDWWTSLWLNEGFASYFSLFILNKLEGTYAFFKDSYFENEVRNCLKSDAGNKFPINFERKNVSLNYFNDAVYCKGGSIVNMVKHIVGERNFQMVVQKYLQVYKYKTVTTKSLQSVLQEYWPSNHASYLDGFFKSFVGQAGYPLITINFFINHTYFTASQECLLAHQKSCPLFTVPISFTTDVEANFLNTTPKYFLSTKNKRFKLSTTTIKWLIVNIQATWYYRVNYNDENWLHIANALNTYNFSGIPLLNRVQIVDDVHHLFCNGNLNAILALKILEYLSYEISYSPWDHALQYLEILLRYSKWKQHNKTAFVREVSDRIYRSLGFLEKKPEGLSPKLRNQIVSLACKYGNMDCLKKVEYYFKNRKLSNFPNDLQFVVYCALVREKNDTFYQEILNLYQSENNSEKKVTILKALGCSKDRNVIEKHFWNILSPIVPAKDKLTALESFYAESGDNAIEVYNLVLKEYRAVTNAFGAEKTVANLIFKISKHFSEKSQKQHMINLINSKNVVRCEEALKILKNTLQILEKNRKCF